METRKSVSSSQRSIYVYAWEDDFQTIQKQTSTSRLARKRASKPHDQPSWPGRQIVIVTANKPFQSPHHRYPSAMSKLITVFGATGNQGGSVVTYILSHPTLSKEYKVRGITRNASKPDAKALAAKGVEIRSVSRPSPFPCTYYFSRR